MRLPSLIETKNLINAAINGDVDVIRDHVLLDIDINISNKYGITLPMIALLNNHEEIAEDLFRLGCDKTIKARNGFNYSSLEELYFENVNDFKLSRFVILPKNPEINEDIKNRSIKRFICKLKSNVLDRLGIFVSFLSSIHFQGLLSLILVIYALDVFPTFNANPLTFIFGFFLAFSIGIISRFEVFKKKGSSIWDKLKLFVAVIPIVGFYTIINYEGPGFVNLLIIWETQLIVAALSNVLNLDNLGELKSTSDSYANPDARERYLYRVYSQKLFNKSEIEEIAVKIYVLTRIIQKSNKKNNINNQLPISYLGENLIISKIVNKIRNWEIKLQIEWLSYKICNQIFWEASVSDETFDVINKLAFIPSIPENLLDSKV